MEDEIRILILEDVPLDAELIEIQLKRDGMEFISKIVDKEEDYHHALEVFKPSIILADHSLPQYDGITALNLARQISPNTPFIFVSGKIGEDFAVEMLKEGATDYVLKNNLSKLSPAVQRALKESREKMEKIGAEKALKEREEKYRTLFEYFPNYVVVLDLEGRIIDVNHAASELSSTPREDLIGRHFMEFQTMISEETPLYQELFSRFLQGEDIDPFESKIRSKGETRLMEIYPAPLKKDGRVFALQLIVQDITERKRAENEVKASLNEKEMLLGEINSRVRNYMQMISSLLELQSIYMKHEENREILKDNKNRVKSMLLIHDGFSQSEDFALIDFSQYLRKLTDNIINSYGVDTNRINIVSNVESIMLDIDTAIPCGLIVNELLTNATKHAFPGDRKGEISIGLEIDSDGNYILTVKDDGVGISDELDFKNSNTLGFQLVNALVNQLNGSVIVSKQNGTIFQVVWSESDY